MTHHPEAPARPADLKAGDTVTMAGATVGRTQRYQTRTPCCSRQVFVSRTDVAFMEKAPRYTVTRYCSGCDWPYEVHVSSPSAFGATFTVCPPPRHYTRKP